MTNIEDRLRDAATALDAPEREVPPFQRLHQRARRRRLVTSVATIVVIAVMFGAITSLVVGGRDSAKRVVVAGPSSTPTSFQTVCRRLGDFGHVTAQALAASAATSRTQLGYVDDLLVDYPTSIPIDHAGTYTWTSPVVVPAYPDSWYFGSGTTGTGDIQSIHDGQMSGPHVVLPDTGLVRVPGGWSLRVTFTIQSFTGSPNFAMISGATAPGEVPPTVAPTAPSTPGTISC